MSEVKGVNVCVEVLRWITLYRAKAILKTSSKITSSLTNSISKIQAGLIKYESPAERDKQLNELREVLYDHCVKIGETLAVLEAAERIVSPSINIFPSEN